jgi:DNA-binding phage protein
MQPTPYDASEYLTSEEKIQTFLSEIYAENPSEIMARAAQEIAERARKKLRERAG